jgi:hypothetical protein
LRRILVLLAMTMAMFAVSAQATPAIKASPTSCSFNPWNPWYEGNGVGDFQGSASCNQSPFWLTIYAQKLYQGSWQTVGEQGQWFSNGQGAADLRMPISCGNWWRTVIRVDGMGIEWGSQSVRLC